MFDSVKKPKRRGRARKKVEPRQGASHPGGPQSAPPGSLGRLRDRGGPIRPFSPQIQTKVTIGKAGDRYEREADAVADRVGAGQRAPEISRIPPGGLGVQRQEEGPKEQGQTLIAQREPAESDSAAESEDSGAAQKSPRESTLQRQASEQGGSAGETATGAEDRDQESGEAQTLGVQRREDQGAEAGEGEEPNVQAWCGECEREERKSGQAKEDDGAEEAQTRAEGSEIESSDGNQEEQRAGQTMEREETAQTQPEREPAESSSEEAVAQRQETGAEDGGEAGGLSASQELGCGGGGGAGGGGGGSGGGGGGCGGTSESASAEPAAASGGGGGGGGEASDSAAESAGEERAREEPVAGGDGGCVQSLQTNATRGEEDTGRERDEAGQSGAQALRVQGAGDGPRPQDGGEEEAQERKESEGGETVQEQSESGGDRDEQAQAQKEAEQQGEEESEQEQREEGGEQAERVQEQEGREEEAQEQSDGEEAQEKGQVDEKQAEESASVQTKSAREVRPTRRAQREAIAARAIRGRGGGEPLPPQLRERLEEGLRFDLSGVRIHAGADASETNRGLKAKAFTHRNHIWLGPGQSQDDLRLMAHEATHVVQQGAAEPLPSAPAVSEGRIREQGPESRETPIGPVPAEETGLLPGTGPVPAPAIGTPPSGVEPETGPGEAGATAAARGDTQAVPSEARAPIAARVHEESTTPGGGIPAAPTGRTTGAETTSLPAAGPGSARERRAERAGGGGTAGAGPVAERLAESPLGMETGAGGGAPAFAEPGVAAAEPPAATHGAETPSAPPAGEAGGGGGATPPAGELTAELVVAEGPGPATPTGAATRGGGAEPPSAGGGAGGEAGVACPNITREAEEEPSEEDIGFTGEPSDQVRQLEDVPPGRAPAAFADLAEGMDGALERRRSAESESPPRAHLVPGPAGIAVGSRRASPTPSMAMPAELPGLRRGAAPTQPVTPHRHAGDPPRVAGVQDPERALGASGAQGGGGFVARARRWLSGFFGAIPAGDNGVDTNPGAPPAARLDGEADLGQIGDLESAGRARVTRQARESGALSSAELGENDIVAEMEEEDLEAPIPRRPAEPHTRCDPQALARPIGFSPAAEAELGVRVRPRLAGGYARERRRLADAERGRDERVDRERLAAQQRIQRRHREAHDRQREGVRVARSEVSRNRRQWLEQDRELQRELDGQSANLGREERIRIEEHRGREQGLIESRYRDTEARARTERDRVARQVAGERNRAQRESGSWLVRAARQVKDRVRVMFRELTQHVQDWFRDLRNRVKTWFDELKVWAVQRIEQLRRWGIAALEAFRHRLSGLVNRYLGRFPAVAGFFLRAIGTAVNGAQVLVDAAARALRRWVVFALELWSRAVDLALRMVELAVIASLSTLCHLTVLGVNLVVLAVERDIDALIELIRDLPEGPPLGGPLWFLVKAGLIGFLECIRDMPADIKRRYYEKVQGIATSPGYYGGYFLGILAGILWDGLVGLIRLPYDIVAGLIQLFSGLYGFFMRLGEDVAAIVEMIASARRLYGDVRAFLAQPDAAEQIRAFVRRSPRVLHRMVEAAREQGRQFARQAGARTVDAFVRYVLETSYFDLGMRVGRVVGELVFDILLTVLTYGGGAAVKAGAKVIQVAVKGMRWLIRGLGRGGRLIMRGMRRVARIVNAGFRMAVRVGRTALRGIFRRLQRLVGRFMGWIRRAFRRRGRPGGDHGDSARWLSFRNALAMRLSSFSERGIGRSQLSSLFRQVRRRFRPTVRGAIRPIRRDHAFWTLWARRRGRLLARRVGRVKMDREFRRRYGNRAVRRALRRLWRRTRNIGESDVDNAIRPFLRRYGYAHLGARFDSENNEFDVTGEMSPGFTIIEKKAPAPARRRIFYGGAEMIAAPLFGWRPGSAPSVSPSLWDAVRPIRTRSGRTSLYVRGHLLVARGGGGSGSEPRNLTPITRSANALMWWRMERIVQRLLLTSRSHVIRYVVRAPRSGYVTPPRRWICEGGNWVHRRVTEEGRLARSITMELVKKRYDPGAKQWVDSSERVGPRTVRNVPRFPRSRPAPPDPTGTCS